MQGVIVNTAAIIVGSLLGLLLKKGIPEKVSGAVMLAMGLCTVLVGVSGMMDGQDTIVIIVSLVLGTLVGTLLNIDGFIQRIGEGLEARFNKSGKNGNIVEGFMTASLLFCIGAMAIIGSINSGLLGDHEVLYTKSVMDLISSCMLASTLGIGVIFAAASVFVYQGAIVLLAGLLQGLLTNEAMIGDITCVGSLMILGLGLNLLGATKLKIADMLPAILFVPIILKLYELLPI